MIVRFASFPRLCIDLSALFCVCVVGCSSPPGITVSRSEYGDTWPFTIERGTLRCTDSHQSVNRPLVTLDSGDGIEYGLNGAARGFGFPDGMKMLKAGMTGADVQPFIDRGLTLCTK